MEYEHYINKLEHFKHFKLQRNLYLFPSANALVTLLRTNKLVLM